MDGILGILLFCMLASIGIMVLVWFRKLANFFKFLQENHPLEYEKMGSPSLVANNTPSNNFSFFKFILGNRPTEIGDKQLLKKSIYLKRFFYIYLVLFVSFIVITMISTAGGTQHISVPVITSACIRRRKRNASNEASVMYRCKLLNRRLISYQQNSRRDSCPKVKIQKRQLKRSLKKP